MRQASARAARTDVEAVDFARRIEEIRAQFRIDAGRHAMTSARCFFWGVVSATIATHWSNFVAGVVSALFLGAALWYHDSAIGKLKALTLAVPMLDDE